MSYFEERLKYFEEAKNHNLVLDIDALNYVSGVTIPDASIYLNDGIATNVTCSTSLYNYRNSVVDKIQIPSSDSLNITGSITLECLFRAGKSGQNAGLISKWFTTSNPQNSCYVLYLGQNLTNNKCGFYLQGTTNNMSFDPQDITYSANEWVHLMATADRITGHMRMYKNGGVSSFGNSSFLEDIRVINTRNLTVGTLRQDDYAYNFFGDIMISRIYNKALTQAEVTARFEEIRGRVGL